MSKYTIPLQHLLSNWRRISILAIAVSFMFGCGSGGSSITVLDVPTEQAGIVISAQFGGFAIVGQPYKGQANVRTNDENLKITSVTVVNTTPGGAPAVIDPAGAVAWTANDKDFAANATIRVVANLSNGKVSSYDFPIDVRKEEIVFSKTLTSNEDNYSDLAGRYIFKITKTDPVKDIVGKIELKENYRSNGEYTWELSAEGDSFKTEVLLAPKTKVSVLLTNAQVQSGLTKQKIQVGLSTEEDEKKHPLQEIDLNADLFSDLNKYGSVLGHKGGGANVYTSRRNGTYYYKKTPTNTSVRSLDEGLPVFWFGASCKAVENDLFGRPIVSVNNECKKIVDTLDPVTKNTKSPIILIHGFAGEDNIIHKEEGLTGGGVETWGSTARLLKDSGHAVFEMRWLSYMPFEDAAGALAKFGKKVAIITGKKPIVLAHSFGGVVSHLAMQNKGRQSRASEASNWTQQWETVNTDNVFLKLITLNSPLSGINGGVNFNPLKRQYGDNGGLTDVYFPRGQDLADLDNPVRSINNCYSITCVQAGANFSGGSLGLSTSSTYQELKLNKLMIDGYEPTYYNGIAEGGVSDSLLEGETIYNLQRDLKNINTPYLTVTGFNNHVQKKPLQNSVGGEIVLAPRLDYYGIGDGLISLLGQSLTPQDFAEKWANTGTELDFKFTFEKSNLPTLKNKISNFASLEKGDCVKYDVVKNKYLICAFSAHTTSTIPKNSEWIRYEIQQPNQTHFAIAAYDGSQSSHALYNLLGTDYLGAPSVNSPFVPFKLAATISGKIVKNPGLQLGIVGALPVQYAVMWATIIDKKTNVTKHSFSGMESDASGKFSVDIGNAIASRFGSDAKLADYRVSLTIDPIRTLQPWHIEIETLTESMDLGDINLSSQAPTLTSITPSSAIANVATTFSVSGSSFPMTATMEIQGATCQVAKLNSATGFTQVCTLRGASGAKVATVKTDTSTNGVLIDANKSVIVSAVPTPTNAASLSLTMDKASLTALGAQEIGVVNYITGKDGRPAIKLGGTDSPAAVRIPNSAAMQFTDGATFDMWVRQDSLTGMDGYGRIVTDGSFAMALIAKSHDRSGGTVLITTLTQGNQGSGLFFAGVGSNWNSCKQVAYPPITLGDWARATVTFSATLGTKTYINQQLIWDCTGGTSFTAMNTQDLYIGKFSDGWYPFNGAIQDINIYKKALTTAEVQALQ
jgi:pimeloyl-ACP methyl ester carboxylesterase